MFCFYLDFEETSRSIHLVLKKINSSLTPLVSLRIEASVLGNGARPSRNKRSSYSKTVRPFIPTSGQSGKTKKLKTDRQN